MQKLQAVKGIFARATLLTRKWEVYYNRQQKPGDLTLKQLKLLIVISNAFKEPPTIKQVAQALTTSHQNVKALSLQLQKKGFIHLVPHDEDKRVTCLVVTTTMQAYWQARNHQDQTVLLSMFEGVDTQDLITTLKTIQVLDDRVADLFK